MSGFTIGASSGRPQGGVGKLLASLFFLFFAGMGGLFIWLAFHDLAPGLLTWRWQRAGCQILSSSVRSTIENDRAKGDFYFAVSYRYAFSGRTYTSTTFSPKDQAIPEYSQAARLVKEFPSGSASVCYVNPANPNESVLRRGSLGMLPFLLLPLVFVLIGLGGLYVTWRARTEPESAKSISESSDQAKGAKVLSLFFLGFLLIGGGTSYPLLLRPVFHVFQATRWQAVPCRIISSSVKTHDSGDGTTYSVDIFYQYQFNGREFSADRYSFINGSSSGHAGKQEVVDRYPPGSSATCFVNPADPDEAVLVRGFTSHFLLALIPLIFVLVGAGGLIFLVPRAKRSGQPTEAITDRKTSTAQSSGPGALPLASASREPLVLKPRTAPWAKLAGALLFAAIWNGLISFLLSDVLQGWQHGRHDWFLTLFSIPFTLVGLGGIVAVGYCFLALFNPRPRVTIRPGALRPGENLTVDWAISGRIEMLRRLNLRVEGREEATYRRGTSTCTDKSLFFVAELADITSVHEMRSGVCQLTLPARVMHSFSSANNKIVWVLQVHGDIPRWPDIQDEYPLTVLPAPNETAHQP
jgi:hypothetical protein